MHCWREPPRGPMV